jgi:hypothetical protein
MKKSRFSEQQIAFVLRQAEEGTPIAGPASEEERPQGCERDSADDAGRVVQSSERENTGEPARANAADIAKAATRQAAGYGEPSRGGHCADLGEKQEPRETAYPL